MIRKSYIYDNTRDLSIKTVGVVGLGLMGHGVAQITAQTGYNVVAIELQSTALDAGLKRIQSSLNKVISKLNSYGCKNILNN